MNIIATDTTDLTDLADLSVFIYFISQICGSFFIYPKINLKNN
jgi:hypothetical protein